MEISTVYEQDINKKLVDSFKLNSFIINRILNNDFKYEKKDSKVGKKN